LSRRHFPVPFMSAGGVTQAKKEECGEPNNDERPGAIHCNKEAISPW
jgi:hypothetical protein